MYRQPAPSSARSYDRSQRAVSVEAVGMVRSLWRHMGADLDASWSRIVGPLTAGLVSSQERAATAAQAYVPEVLEDTGQARKIAAAAEVATAPLYGVAGDGRPIDTLMYGAVVRTRTEIAAGTSTAAALRHQLDWLTRATSTLIADTARQSEALAIGVRPIAGYVRMLTPPSCSRCVVLAGRYYRKNAGFQRHPECDCRHIPASESLAGDMSVDPQAYFDSLTKAEQDRVFTQAGAEAIRSGADVFQVVNARRGMTVSQSGRLIPDRWGQYTTKEGTGRRGRYGQMRGRAPRMMPESISRMARDRDDYLRLLRGYGYIL